MNKIFNSFKLLEPNILAKEKGAEVLISIITTTLVWNPTGLWKINLL